jgi:hypothetical protein
MTPKKLTRQVKGRSGLFVLLAVIFVAAVFLIAGYAILPYWFPLRYDVRGSDTAVKKISSDVTHLETPIPVRALYMTACTAAEPSLRGKLVDLAVKTEINSLVVDIKDYSGIISIPSANKELQTDPQKGCHIPDIKDFIASLHQKGIYIIGRITVFQDPYYSKLHPELAVKRASDNLIWRDYKGLSYIDVGAKPYWDYISLLGHEAIALGFDELNFDYIRFPSDGNMENISYPWTGKMEKKEALRKFYGYLKKEFRGTGTILSADLFGMTTTNTDDLNIGQYLEYTLPYFDYVAPMVYPSHFPPTWNGYKNPAAKPYEVVHYSMEKAYERASTTPNKLRPWLQDFDLGAIYTADMVKAEIKAVYDVGLSSWMLWDASNKYTAAALNWKE